MKEYIYKYKGIYCREITDMLGNSIFIEEITQQQYLDAKNLYN